MSNDNNLDNKKQRSKRKIVLEWTIYIGFILLCAFVVPRYVAQRTIVDGQSMENTLHDEENLLVEKLSYKFGNPNRYDIIVFYPYGREIEDEYYVKRVIGLPGETVQIKDSVIYINGNALEDGYLKEPIEDPGVASEEILLSDNEYFVLGDNPQESCDSRDIGPIEGNNIEGRVIFRMYPFDKFGPMTNK